ncbi:binding-protein-dependent transport systems inner membrane component [Candidatus Moduliflexus flocculans]|uniref:Binding-protein-dependent transport systems inner membrane component n=1 Tax=Candidatus Moduliflexus flocculans TaxID=1499966 RepID=A0A081BPI4_9BACT|nr:binding-protein-dependent transport systems inner membrane component [Candidatus Moduliflexus flocculans]
MKRSLSFQIFVYVAITAITFALLFPFFVAISTSLKDIKEVYMNPTYWIPKRLAWENFSHLWEKYPMAQYFLNSLYVASGATLLTMIFCIPAAYAFARLRFPGRKFLLFTLLVVQMFSPIIVVIALYKIMVLLHLIDKLSSLVIVNAVFTLAFSTWMMNGYFDTIPKEIEEAAMIDGCSRLQIMTRITLPIAMPGVVTVVIYTFIAAWNEFMFALTFISTTEKRPLTLGLYNFIGRWTVQWHYLMAAALLALIPVIILFMLIEKQLVSGLAGGAVKG